MSAAAVIIDGYCRGRLFFASSKYLAAVMLRLELPVLTMVFGETTGYEIVAWSCWIPNLLIAQVILQGLFLLPKTRAGIRKQSVRQA